MRQNYKWCIDRIISKYEGKYSNDPGDPGGPTMYGITYIDLAEYSGVDKRQTYGMMQHMSLSTAEDIYAKKYETKSRFDELQSGVDMCVLDYDINSGVGRGPRVLQAILGLRQTGIMDDATVFAANKMEPHKLIDAICDERLHFMHQIRNGASWKHFGKGWGARVTDLRVTSKLVADGKIIEVPHTEDQIDPAGMGKATHIDPSIKGSVTKSAGLAALGSGGASHVATGSLWTTGFIVGGVILVGGFAYYELVRSQKLKQDKVILPFPVAA